MGKSNRFKLLNIISGAKDGGAEKFFERLSISFENSSFVKQKVIIKKNSNRYNYLKKYIHDIDQISFFNFYNPFLNYKINKVFNEFKPDIVLSWMNRASSLIPRLRFFKEIKIGRLGGYYKIKNYLSCDYLITNTQDLKDYVCSQGWEKEKVEFIPNFVGNKNFSKKKINSEKKIILCFGRFHKNKGIEILIKSMKFLPNYKLWIIGSGKLYDSYITLIKKLKLNDTVKIFDWTDNISQFLNVGNVLVCPSIHEPFGNIILDGWSHKIPVIASDIGGPSVLIKEGYNGLKFQKGDCKELAIKLEKLLKNQKLCLKLATNGFKTFKKYYSEDIITQKYINFFRKVIS